MRIEAGCSGGEGNIGLAPAPSFLIWCQEKTAPRERRWRDAPRDAVRSASPLQCPADDWDSLPAGDRILPVRSQLRELLFNLSVAGGAAERVRVVSLQLGLRDPIALR